MVKSYVYCCGRTLPPWPAPAASARAIRRLSPPPPASTTVRV
jgi:hypothetical protein